MVSGGVFDGCWYVDGGVDVLDEGNGFGRFPAMVMSKTKGFSFSFFFALHFFLFFSFIIRESALFSG